MEMYQQADSRYVDEMLRNSFAAIKRDIEQLRAAHAMQLSALRELQERASQSTVSADRLSSLQAKVTDLTNDVKQLRKVEERIDALNNEIAGIPKSLKADFKEHERHARGEFKEYGKSIDADIQTLNKKIENHLVRFDEKLTESIKLLDKRTADAVLNLRKEVGKFSDIQKEQGKIQQQLTGIRAQTEQLTQKGMALFEERAKTYGERVADHLREADARLQQHLGTVSERMALHAKQLQEHLNAQSAQVNQQLNEQAKQVNAQMGNVRLALERAAADQATFTQHVHRQLEEKISRPIIEKLVEDINREFNNLKQLMVKDFQRIDEEFKKHGKFLREKKFKSSVTEIHDEFDRLKDRVNYIDTSKISKGYFDQQLDELRNDLATAKDELMVIKATAMSDRSRKDELVAELKRVEANRSPARKKAYRGLAITSTVLLLAALTLAIVGAGTYFTWGAVALYWTLSYVGSAIVTFAAGLIIRLVVWGKRRKVQSEEQMRLTEVETGDAPF